MPRGGDDEESPGGSRMLRHAARENGWTPAEHGDPDWMRAIEEHFGAHVAPADRVFHELASDLVHIDVHQVPPGGNRPFWTLFTTGMSALPMTMPKDARSSPFAELVVLLPPHWKMMDQESFKNEEWYWPIRLLKSSS